MSGLIKNLRGASYTWDTYFYKHPYTYRSKTGAITQSRLRFPKMYLFLTVGVKYPYVDELQYPNGWSVSSTTTYSNYDSHNNWLTSTTSKTFTYTNPSSWTLDSNFWNNLYAKYGTPKYGCCIVEYLSDVLSQKSWSYQKSVTLSYVDGDGKTIYYTATRTFIQNVTINGSPEIPSGISIFYSKCTSSAVVATLGDGSGQTPGTLLNSSDFTVTVSDLQSAYNSIHTGTSGTFPPGVGYAPYQNSVCAAFRTWLIGQGLSSSFIYGDEIDNDYPIGRWLMHLSTHAYTTYPIVKSTDTVITLY